MPDELKGYDRWLEKPYIEQANREAEVEREEDGDEDEPRADEVFDRMRDEQAEGIDDEFGR